MSNVTQITIGNADYNAIVEDQRNIVEILQQEPNTVVVTVPGVSSLSARTNVSYGEGAPWTIEVEI
ncbi:hypothetical protein UFOVP1217_69 [uncultured Caudovirales phage]|uniref:Uncharacterized protein n=1 Tax=uncultured Caudovirales phage TaxID=2100421 RepID=A0A6J5MF48_9CAUD|nr:hypothetical protein UFOVP465_147 [uncultured Caudovirales phage]CAB4155416.1 hypothetical protein UFOVP666_5 [uncultured Caudovirales phage]CAB4160181.1 hypothetical protein UFOVP727_82 [uncultured Caudovirales phage]CAB4164552.1 hypothetical protein UFOVP819_33 [uncultured Caudovirales phage]CAB4172194.1 hypothetical protein UFOVP926_54 [uncultured Caudovirales phage]